MKKRYYGFLIALLAVFLLAVPAAAADSSTEDAGSEAVQEDGTGAEQTEEDLFTGVSEDRTGETSDYFYYVFGEKTSYTGFAKDADEIWYYVEEGQVDFSRSSVIKDVYGVIGTSGTYWYVVDGVVQTSFTGLADYPNKNGWWYITEGQVDFTYNGFAENSNGIWYLEKSKVIFSKNSVVKDAAGAIGMAGIYWYVVGGEVQTSFTGLADYPNRNGWWYITEGQVDFTYNGFAENCNGIWYLEESKVNFSKNSVEKDVSGVIGTSGTYWYILGGKVQTSFTGLADYPNRNGWWYIENGHVTFTKNTVAKNKNGWYYVVNSKVQFGFTGLADYPNQNGWWYITKGHVDFSKNTVAKNKNGWYYVTGGKVQFGYTGVANYSNANGWWYVKNAKVDFTFTGISSNKNGNWYVKNGKVDFSYNGTLTYSGTEWKVVNGKATEALSAAAQATYARAQAVVAKITNDSMTKEQKLKVCFDYVKSAYSESRPRTPHYLGMDWPVVYADDMFVRGTGNCFSYAAAFAYMAKAIGYTNVYCCTSGGHAWAEIDGLIYDPEWSRHYHVYSYYALSYDTKTDVNYKAGIAAGLAYMHIKI